jgi:hypothetical protein
LYKILHEVQNMFASRWGPRGIWTFVQGIDNDVGRELSWKIEHALEALCERDLARLFQSITARLVKLRKKVPARIRVVNELQEK